MSKWHRGNSAVRKKKAADVTKKKWDMVTHTSLFFFSLADTVLRPFPSRPIITSISVNHHGALKFFFSSSFPPEATNVFPLRLISLSWDKKEGRPAAAAAMPAGEGGRQDARGAYTRYVRISYARQDCVRRSHHLPPYSLPFLGLRFDFGKSVHIPHSDKKHLEDLKSQADPRLLKKESTWLQ